MVLINALSGDAASPAGDTTDTKRKGGARAGGQLRRCPQQVAAPAAAGGLENQDRSFFAPSKPLSNNDTAMRVDSLAREGKRREEETERKRIRELVGALSPVNHRGLHQG